MKTELLFAILFLTAFSIVMSENAYGSLSLDKGDYSWTDKVKIRLMVHGFDHKQDTIQISVGDNELKSYKLSKAGNGLYTGEVILTGFSHDVDGDGKPDTNPRTTGSGPNNGFLESIRDENLEVSVRFQDGTKMKTTTKITWNVGEISFDMSNHQFGETGKLQAIDPDMNLNPETLDKLPIHVFSDSDKAGILVDAIETEEESGIFETTISFTQNSVSSGNRLFVISGDVIYAQYTDHTLPKPYDIHDDLEIVAESTVHDSLIAEPEQDEPIPENCGPGTVFENGICVVDEIKGNHTDTSVQWGGPAYSHDVKPPLKQFKLGIPIDEIQCGNKLVLIQKDDGSPACVKPGTSVKLVEREWTTPVSEWPSLTPIMPELGKFGTYKLEKDGITFDIKYYIKGGSDIVNIIPDKNHNAINITLTSFDATGSLKITLPRQLIDAKIDENADDLFFVFIDDNEVPYTETTTDTARTLTIQFEKNSKMIQIIGTVSLQEGTWDKKTDDESSDTDIIKYSPVLFKGTGIDLEGEELITLLLEKQEQFDSAFDELGVKGLYPIVEVSLSIGHNAYSIDEKYVGSPIALEISVLKDEFTKTNLEKINQLVRKYVGDEIDIVYSKGGYAVPIPW